MAADVEPDEARRVALPGWARELVTLYESNAANQFILHGNVGDRMMLPLPEGPQLGGMMDFLLRVLLPRFDVILSYDVGNGIRVEKGEKTFTQWPYYRENTNLPKAPFNAIETLTRYFRYCGNLARMGRERIHVACILRAADLIVPGFQGGLSYELNAMALQVRDWTTETLLTEMPLATFLIAENLNDLHPQLVNNTRVARIQAPLPSAEELERAFDAMAPAYPVALGGVKGIRREDTTVEAASSSSHGVGKPLGSGGDAASTGAPGGGDVASTGGGAATAGAAAWRKAMAQQLAGATLASVEGLLKRHEYRQDPIDPEDLARLKKELVEKDCNGLIEFIESTNTLDDLYGQEKIKEWLRQDIALWRKNETEALPMGYLLCGPVGTGKTFMVRCLAGQAGVPVVKIKNFRDKWVGSSEGNLEKIFRLLHALGRCFVFIDEADQALGKRDSGGEDSGVSGRLYSMMAEEMSDTRNRGKIIWILASSRPDLIEVDLKRPGRIDVKIPIFPTTTPQEGFALIRALCRRRGLDVPESAYGALEKLIPDHLTPGAAEALAVKVFRLVKTHPKYAPGQQLAKGGTLDALRDCLTDYRSPVAPEVMDFQIGLALQEASDLEFVPAAYRQRKH